MLLAIDIVVVQVKVHVLPIDGGYTGADYTGDGGESVEKMWSALSCVGIVEDRGLLTGSWEAPVCAQVGVLGRSGRMDGGGGMMERAGARGPGLLRVNAGIPR